MNEGIDGPTPEEYESGKPKAETLNDIETQQLAFLLSKLKPEELPLQVFLEVARLTVTPIVEVVPVRENSEKGIEVLLIQRELDDPTWPGMLHTPGTVVRAGDEPGSLNDAFSRIKGELGGASLEPVFVETFLHNVKRGKELAQVFYAEVNEQPEQGQFYPANNLPENIIDTQRLFITNAVTAFKQRS